MDVKEAVGIAKNHFASVFEKDGGRQATLEEVWYSSGEKVWYVTVGVLRVDALGIGSKLHYKTVKISDRDGKLISIKNADAA
jgi:hypothetical protein